MYVYCRYAHKLKLFIVVGKELLPVRVRIIINTIISIVGVRSCVYCESRFRFFFLFYHRPGLSMCAYGERPPYSVYNNNIKIFTLLHRQTVDRIAFPAPDRFRFCYIMQFDRRASALSLYRGIIRFGRSPELMVQREWTLRTGAPAADPSTRFRVNTS